MKQKIYELLKKYEVKKVSIKNKVYDLYVIPELCDEDINLYQGFIFSELAEKESFNYFKTKYKPPLEGYSPRIGIFIYKNKLLIKDYFPQSSSISYIVKQINKINKSFYNKLKSAILRPNPENFKRLFDRTDVIDDFYKLFNKTRQYLLKKITGLANEKQKLEFVDNFMMQMLTLWYLQEKRFFDNNQNFFIDKFNQYRNNRILFGKFSSYFEFLTYFFKKISDSKSKQYIEDAILGKVIVIGPAVFLNGDYPKTIEIPDECFYKEGITEILIVQKPDKIAQDIPLLNLFESRDWIEGDIDEFVLGALYEKLMNVSERKKTGAYYTPEEITKYISENTIKPYLLDKIKEKYTLNSGNLLEVINNANKEQLIYIFKLLKDIKILDPAVGSGHFLESAINVLIEIYQAIKERALQLKIENTFTIESTNEIGELIEYDLTKLTDDDEFNLLVKFFIILSRNIYGVDINPSAIKVAKARFFLSLAKHFYPIEITRKHFIRFPNVHFNLREGNSLIGYTNLGEEKKRQLLQLNLSFNSESSKKISKQINLIVQLKNYLQQTASRLKLQFDIDKDFEQLNIMLTQSNITWKDFKKILEIKEKLIKILIVSLNSSYANPINELLQDITALFNKKLDEKLAKQLNISEEYLKRAKTFHWIFEFPEIFFRNNPGFDIIIGNPPYGNIISSDEVKLMFKFYRFKLGEENNNASIHFIERAYYLLRENGYLSFIVPKSLAFVKNWRKTREFLLKENILVRLVDNGQCFKDVLLEMLTFIAKKNKKNKNYDIEISRLYTGKFSKFNNFKTFIIDKKFINEEIFLISVTNSKMIKAYQAIREKSIYLNNIAEMYRGLSINNKVAEKKLNENYIPILCGKSIKRYRIDNICYVNKNIIPNNFRPGDLVFQEIVAHIYTPIPHIKLIGAINKEKYYNVNTVTNIKIKDGLKFSKEFILGILHSSIINWYIYKFIYVNAFRTMHFSGEYIKYIPIPNMDNEQINEISTIVSKIINGELDTKEGQTYIDKIVLDFYKLENLKTLLYEY